MMTQQSRRIQDRQQSILFWAMLLLALSFLTMNAGLPLFFVVCSIYGRWLLLLVVLGVGIQSAQTQARVRTWSSMDTLLILMLVLFGFSTLYSEQPARSWPLYLVYCLELIAIGVIPRILPPRYWRKLFLCMAAIISTAAGAALYGYSSGSLENDFGGRLGTELTNPNSIGASCMLAILIIWTYLITQRGWKRWIVAPVQVILLVSLYLTGSKSAIAGFFCGTVFIFVLLRRRAALLIVLLLSMVTMATFGYLNQTALQSFQEDIANRILRVDNAGDLLATRRGSWEAALTCWRAHPWLGNGFGVTDPYGERPIDGSGYHGLLASVGVVGTIAFALPALVLLWKVWRTTRSQYWQGSPVIANDPREVLILGSGPIVGLLVQGVGEPWMIGVGSLMSFMYLFGIGGCLSAIVWIRHGERRWQETCGR